MFKTAKLYLYKDKYCKIPRSFSLCAKLQICMSQFNIYKSSNQSCDVSQHVENFALTV